MRYLQSPQPTTRLVPFLRPLPPYVPPTVHPDRTFALLATSLARRHPEIRCLRLPPRSCAFRRESARVPSACHCRTWAACRWDPAPPSTPPVPRTHSISSSDGRQK